MQWYQYVFIIVVFFIIALAIAKSNRKDVALEFNKLVEYLEKLKKTIDQTTLYTTFDGVDDESQHKIINLLTSSIESTIDQIHFFLGKGISAMNIDKTRAIFNAVVKKIYTFVENYEEVLKHVDFDEKGNVIKKDN